MAFKLGTQAFTNVLRLYSCVIVLQLTVSATKKSINIANNNITATKPCTFPAFLQTNCSSSSNVCEWTLGERISLPLGEIYSPPSKFLVVRGTAEWSWSVLNSTIIISHIQAAILKPLSKTIQRKFQCLETVGNSSNTFIIAKIELLEDKQSSNITYNCIQFIRRGETVVQYKLGNWINGLGNFSCIDKDMLLQDFPLISDRYFGLFDCPSALRGAFDILSVYDSETQRNCRFPNDTQGTLESDCLSKEGIYIDFGHSHNCTDPGLGNQYPSEMKLRCHNKPWRDGNYTYVITSRIARWSHEYGQTSFQCLKYENTAISKEEFDLFLFNQPKCERLFRAVKKHFDKSKTLILRIRRKGIQAKKPIWTPNRCMFPAVFQGAWEEESTHKGIEKIKIKDGNLTFSSGDSFECIEHYSFKHRYSGCSLGEENERWPIPGRVGFFIDDYTLLSRFDNGCRARVTRLGVSSTVGNRILSYRLSQSEPMVNDGKTAQEYYEYEILRRFCSKRYLYEKDPYPFWGRNIEKIIYKAPLSDQPIDKCTLVFNSRHNLLSTVSVSQSTTTCPGKTTKIYFGCKESASTTRTLRIVYNPDCLKKDLAFTCIGKAWKFGHFILLRDTVTQRLSCVWFDKESNAILRLNSSQCSDVDWGRLPGHENNYVERFKIKYFEKCPFVHYPTLRAKVNSSESLVGHSLVWKINLVISISFLVLSYLNNLVLKTN